jgi:hypothetical protein
MVWMDMSLGPKLPNSTLKNPEIFRNGSCIRSFLIDDRLRESVLNENWDALDAQFRALTLPGAEFYNFLKTFHDFWSIDFIISIRDSANDWEEDGIWHDDGTRVFAFSISFTFMPETLEGGQLEIRQKESESVLASIATPRFGDVILFLTGVHGLEHRTRRVLKGRRTVIAGWCSAESSKATGTL